MLLAHGMLRGLLFVIAYLFSTFSYAQDTLRGNIEVGQGKRFATLTIAAQAYNTSVLDGHVAFLLTDSLYASSESFPVTLSSNPSASQNQTLTIRPAAGNHATIRGTVVNNPLILVTGSHIHFNGSNGSNNTRDLSIINLSANSPRVINFSSVGTQHVEFCSLKNTVLINGNDRSVITLSSRTSTSTPGFFRNITIENNVFNASLYGIFAVARAVSGNGTGISILNNDMSTGGDDAIRLSGIYLRGVDGTIIRGNKVGRFDGTDSATDRGIWLADSCRNVEITKNEIFSLHYTGNKGCGSIGILVATGMVNANVLIANNMIHGISGDGNDISVTATSINNPTGILIDNTIASQSGIRILFNSIYLGGEPGITNTLNRTRAISSCIRLRGSSRAEIRNNILVNSLGLTGSTGLGSFCVFASQSNNLNDSMNQNIYYNGTLGNGIKAIGYVFNTSMAYTSLGSWQGFTGKDGSSLLVLPKFISFNDLRLTEDNQSINNKGKVVAGLGDDFRGVTRSSQNPDVGCFEFNAAGQRFWTGLVSGDWNDPGNWSANEPVNDTTDLLFDPSRSYCPIIADTVSIRNLLMEFPTDTMLLQLDSGACLRLRGQITRVRGKIAASKADIEMNGSEEQNIPDGLFLSNQLGGLIISNTSSPGVRIGGPLEILNRVEFTDSGKTLQTEGHLVLKSNINRTAYIGNLTGKSVIGEVTVEAFVPAGIFHGRAWHLLSTPIFGNQTIRQSWQESATSLASNPAPGFGTMLTSPATNALANGYDLRTPAGGTLNYFDTSSQRFIPVSSTFQSISNQPAYLVLIRGDRSSSSFNAPVVNTKLRTKGSIYNALNTQPVPPAIIAPGKFHLLGNRLSAPIDWTKLNKTGDLDDVFYVWDPELGNLGGYQTISGLNGYIPIPGGTRLFTGNASITNIEQGKGFFVRGSTNGVGASVTFPESAKTSTGITARTTTIQQNAGISFRLYSVQDSAKTMLLDGCRLIHIDADSGTGLIKLFGNEEQLSIEDQTQFWTLRSKSVLTEFDTVALKTKSLRYQSYRLAIQNQWPISIESNWVLFDRILNREMILPDTGTFNYVFSVNAYNQHQTENRFRLYTKTVQVLSISDVRLNGTSTSENRDLLFVTSSDWTGVREVLLEYSANGREFHSLKAWNNPEANVSFSHESKSNVNYYRLKLTDFSNRILYSQVLVLRNMKTNQSIEAVRAGDNLNLRLNVDASSTWNMRVFDQSNKLVKKQEVALSKGFSQVNINLFSGLSSGLYTVELVHQKGDRLFTRFLW